MLDLLELLGRNFNSLDKISGVDVVLHGLLMKARCHAPTSELDLTLNTPFTDNHHRCWILLVIALGFETSNRIVPCGGK